MFWKGKKLPAQQLSAGVTETNHPPLHSDDVDGQDENPKEHQALTPALQQCYSIPSDSGTEDQAAFSQALSDGPALLLPSVPKWCHHLG